MGIVIPVRRREYKHCSYSKKVSIESEMAKQWNEFTMFFDRKRSRLTVIKQTPLPWTQMLFGTALWNLNVMYEIK